LLPAALQGFDIDGVLAGAKACDEVTRQDRVLDNPAALLALAWFFVGHGKGDKAMVVLPYKDRLELFAKYLQQLVMESLGKEKALDGLVVNQGLTVYGNKGSTDQHAYVQQLRDGPNTFFVTFIQVLEDRSGPPLSVDQGITSGDYLSGFLLGTRQALFENERQSITLTITTVDAFRVGLLIALFERAVGFYASLININPYHQPGVEAGKKAAETVLKVQREVLRFLGADKARSFSVVEIAEAVPGKDRETVFHICQHLAANRRLKHCSVASPFSAKYQAS
jgi:glucose-6-phosphate isomerase